jgi:hypothetical protein
MTARDHLILVDVYFVVGMFLVLWLVLRVRRLVAHRRERRAWRHRLARVNAQKSYRSGTPTVKR